MYSKKSAKQKLWNARSYLTLARKFAPNFKSKKLWIVQYCMCKLYLSKNVCLWFVKRLILPTFLFTEILLLVKRNLFYVQCSVAIHKKSLTQGKVTLCSRSYTDITEDILKNILIEPALLWRKTYQPWRN